MMTTHTSVRARSIVLALGLLTPACEASNADGDADAGAGDLKPTGEGPCEEADECAGLVCVGIATDSPPIYCSEPCDGGCPSGFYCDTSTFALVGLEFCRVGADEPPPAPEPPPEPPRLPCNDDDDCDGDLVCATFEGERDCTIPCAAEADCTPPTVNGVTIDLLTCAADEGADRDVCVPDLACYPNLSSCVDGLPGV